MSRPRSATCVLFVATFVSQTATVALFADDMAECDSSTALLRLQEGNQRFVTGKSTHPHEKFSWRASLEDQQHPFAFVLGCSDSRVPPELIFDQGFGDLFVIRVAGNVVDTDVKASIEYATDHLETKLVVVMGHTHCGAVTAAVDHHEKYGGKEPQEIMSLIARIDPAVCADGKCTHAEKIEKTVISNVELAVAKLRKVPDLKKALKSRGVKLVGAVYDMHTGEVRFLELMKPVDPAADTR